jgi:hypothetical protein
MTARRENPAERRVCGLLGAERRTIDDGISFGYRLLPPKKTVGMKKKSRANSCAPKY